MRFPFRAWGPRQLTSGLGGFERGLSMACTSSLTLGGLRRQLFPCIACTRVHLVNLKIGKVLGEDND